MSDSAILVRPFEAGDESAVVGVWYRSGRAAYTFLPTWQTFTVESAEAVFRNVIRPKCDIWVGTLHQTVVAYLAMNGSCIDRMYVDPIEWRNGWGARLVALAKWVRTSNNIKRTMRRVRSMRSRVSSRSYLA